MALQLSGEVGERRAEASEVKEPGGEEVGVEGGLLLVVGVIFRQEAGFQVEDLRFVASGIVEDVDALAPEVDLHPLVEAWQGMVVEAGVVEGGELAALEMDLENLCLVETAGEALADTDIGAQEGRQAA